MAEASGAPSPWRLCVAPMLDRTDRHCRYLLRLLAADARLYSEMITTGALLHGRRADLLAFDPAEQPVALQLGGSDPGALRACAVLAQDAGYAEVNLNVGCPSVRVSAGRFGACLMTEPALVGECVAAMRSAVRIPVTVKTRLGVDDRDRWEHLVEFIATVAAAGCEVFVLHARKAWLKGLSPAENRSIPPLRHDWVYRIKREFPRLAVVINGGIRTSAEAAAHLRHCDGVMLGREVYDEPMLLARLQRDLFEPARQPPSREAVVGAMCDYFARLRQEPRPPRLHAVSRHMLGLFRHQPGARAWRRYLSEHAGAPDAGPEVLRLALQQACAPAQAPRRSSSVKASAASAR